MNELILTPGRVLVGQQYQYHLGGKPLGAGKYGEVWPATRRPKTTPDVLPSVDVVTSVDENSGADAGSPVDVAPAAEAVTVALKAMRPGLPEVDQRSFWFEVEILAQLRVAEEKAKFWTDNESRLPLVLDTGAADEDQPAFFVQPLAQGTPLDELLRAQGRLPETEALEIIGQVSRVFQLLHQATGRSYLDFQPKNIFWDAASQRVLVIDWNLLSEVGAGQEADDLAALAGLLYRSVMGLPAPLAGSVRALAQPAERWAAVSRPTQRLLTKALHPNASTRYQTMDELVAAIDKAHKVWRDCADPAFKEGLTNYVEQAAAAKATISDPTQSSETRQTARLRVEQAADWLSVARQYEGFDEAKQHEIEQVGQPLTAWLTGQGAFTIGRQFFNVPSYEEAARQFEQAAAEAWSDETALTARRWQAATAAAQKGRYEAGQRMGLTSILDSLAGGEGASLEQAEQALTKLPAAETLALLRVEIALRRGLPQAAQQSEAGDFQAGATTVERLAAQMATLPPEDQAALTGVSGDLTALAAQYRAGAAAAKETAALTALFERNFETGFAELQRKLDAKPGDQALIAAAQSLAAQYRVQDRVQAPKQAGRLAALALDYTPANETRQKLLDDWNQSRENLDNKLDHYVRAAQMAELDKTELEKARKEEVRLAQIAAVTAAGEAERARAEKDAAEARVAQAETDKRKAEMLTEQALQAQYAAEGEATQAKAAKQAEAAKAAEADRKANEYYEAMQTLRSQQAGSEKPQLRPESGTPPLDRVAPPPQTAKKHEPVNEAAKPQWYNRTGSRNGGKILFAGLIGVMVLLMMSGGGLMVFNFISQRQAAAAAVAQQQAKLATKNAKQTDTAATATVAAKQTGTAVAQETPLTATGTPTATSTATPIVTDTPVVIATLGSPPDADSDGDGVTDVEETTRGTDPNLNTAPLTFPVEGSELPVLPWRITFPAVETDPESLPVKLSVTQIVDGKAAAPSESQVAFIKTGAFYEYQREVGEGDPRPTGPYRLTVADSATQREWTAAITLTGQTVEGVVNANIGRFGRPFFTDPAETQALLETTLKNASVIVLGRFEFHDANGQIPKANFGFGDVTQNWCYLQKKDDGGYGWTYCQYTGAKGFEALPLLAPAEVVEVEAAPVPPLPTVTPSPTETPIPTSTLEAQAIISPVVTPIDITATPGIFTTIIDPAQVMTEKNGSTPVPNVPPGQVTVVSNESGEVTSQWLQVTWSTDEASSIIGWVRVKDTDWLKLNPELSDEQLQLRPEPSDGATSNLLPLNKGDRIILNEEKVADDTKIWLKVSNPEGQEGWIKADFTNYAIQPQ